MEIDASALYDLGKDLGKGPKRFVQQAVIAVRKTALDIEGTAKSIVAVDTGNLKNTIGHSDFRTMSGSSIEAEVGPTAEYGHYVEKGTSRMAAQPYMAPALEAHEGAFEAILGDIAERAALG